MKNFLSSLIEQENLEQESIISIIGAGGKTTLLYALGDILSKKNKVILTTTTKMYYPSHLKDSQILLENDINKLYEKDKALVFLGSKDGNKIKSLNHKFLIEALSLYDQLIIEADGAKMLPIKIKNEQEPVILKGCNCVIQVIGLSCLNQKIKDVLFRYKIACETFNIDENSRLNVDLLKKIILYNFEGIDCCKKIILFNQVDKLNDILLINKLKESFDYPVYVGTLLNNISYKEN